MRQIRDEKDSIERLQQKKIEGFSKQRRYFQTLLTQKLPKYHVKIDSKQVKQEQKEQINQSIVQVQQVYFEVDISDQKQVRKLLYSTSHKRKQWPPVKLKKTQNEKQVGPKNKKSMSKSQIKLPQNFLKKQNQRKLCEQQIVFHPYSILLQLQNEQKQLPNQQKKVYKYRKNHDLKTYQLQDINKLIDQLILKSQQILNINSSKGLSVTDQFILSKYIDLKIKKVFQKPKKKDNMKEKKDQAQNIKKQLHSFNPQRNKQKQAQPNPQLMKAFQQIKFIWELYELKLNKCPDLIKGSQKDQKVYQEIKNLFRDLTKLQDQLTKKKQIYSVMMTPKNHKAFGYNKTVDIFSDSSKSQQNLNNKLSDQVINKKVKAIMRRFKQIITTQQ